MKNAISIIKINKLIEIFICSILLLSPFQAFAELWGSDTNKWGAFRWGIYSSEQYDVGSYIEAPSLNTIDTDTKPIISPENNASAFQWNTLNHRLKVIDNLTKGTIITWIAKPGNNNISKWITTKWPDEIFTDILLTGGDTIYIGFEKEMSWKKKSEFNVSDKYMLNIYIVNEKKELFIKKVEINNNENQYKTFFTINDSNDIGQWKIKIEIDDNPSFYGLSKSIVYVKEIDSEDRIIGEQILPPDGADSNKKPSFDEKYNDAFYYDSQNKKLYAIGRPDETITIIWEGLNENQRIPVKGVNIWPENPIIHVAESLPVELNSKKYQLVDLIYRSDSSNAEINGSKQFICTSKGHSVLHYAEKDFQKNEPVFKVIKTVSYREILEDRSCTIGQRIINENHESPDDKTGYIVNEIAPYASNTKDSTPYDGYNRDERKGPIVAVNKVYNDDDLIVIWYQQDDKTQTYWPSIPIRYTPEWPSNPKKIIIASMSGTGDLDINKYKNIKVYEQNDSEKPGFNPNEEHAHIIGTNRLYAQRDDLNKKIDEQYIIENNKVSEAYSILMYQDPTKNEKWFFDVYKVIREENPYFFRYKVKAGRQLEPPYPLSLKPCVESIIVEDENKNLVTWRDYKEQIWIKAGSKNNKGPVEISARFFEKWNDECTPWLDDGTGEPITIVYEVYWPDDDIWEDGQTLPEITIGDTLVEPKNGLPEINSQCSVNILFDQVTELTNDSGHSAKLVSIMDIREVPLTLLPSDIKTLNKDGKIIFVDLPYHLRRRISYDPINYKLQIKGVFDHSGMGEPLILLNVLHDYETQLLKDLSPDSDAYIEAVEALSVLTKTKALENAKEVFGTNKTKALSTGSATGMEYTSYVTLIFNSDERCSPLPISMEIIKVVPKLYTGEIKLIEPDSVFDERMTLRHNADFNADTKELTFEWKYKEPDNGEAPYYEREGKNDSWTIFPPNKLQSKFGGALDITIEGSGYNTLKDYYYIVRYKGFDVVGKKTWSEWTEPALCEGWLKRVVNGINPYNQRFNDFHNSEVSTTTSMIVQAGKRYEGAVALNSDSNNLNQIGLIELYETVLRQGKTLSIDGAPSINDEGVNNQLLLAAGKIADLYMLLGNEAYADATDPTIGFDTNDGQVGSEASSLFSFKNQLPSLLEEEIALLRGREETGAEPVYNKLIWNYSKDSGEVAYNSNYNIEDMDADGDIDEEDAKQMFPQGHGDAWGHYLTAIKTYYNLLIHPNYTWAPRKESINIAGKPVEVDYYDERKFAQSAAARAKTGSEIVNLTYLNLYSENSSSQCAGYKDPVHAWGVSGWAIRSAQGAYFDWVVANKLIPAHDNVNQGIAKIDRTTVLEIRDISSHVTEIQSLMDKSDIGLNPLGLAQNVVPFDIDPSMLNPAKGENGQTHFEQIYERAVKALNNAIVLFNHANENSKLIRRQQDILSKFKENINNQIFDLNNRLKEIFGEPYPEDIGPGGYYPEGYKGPDLYHYSYVDPGELMGIDPQAVKAFKVNINNHININNDGSITKETKEVTFHLSTTGFGFIKPSNWKETRNAPGEIQIARSDLIQANAQFQRALVEYNNLIAQIETSSQSIEEKFNLNADSIQIQNDSQNTQISLNDKIKNARASQLKFRTQGQKAVVYANAIAEGFPSIYGVIAGTANGFFTDMTSLIRSGLKTAASITNFNNNNAADKLSLQELDHQQAKEIVQSLTNIKLDKLYKDFSLRQEIIQLEQLIRNEATKRLEIYIIQENMQQTQARYLTVLSKGLRLLEELKRFEKQTASEIQDYRYKDMAFRIFRNDALQKYRAQFDLAARYVYLTAKAYDYETNMLSQDQYSGNYFLDNIVKQRLIGLVKNGLPITGVGLTDPMARMKQNFDVIKSQFGLNNPQTETNQFSLRRELFRIKTGESSNKKWQNILEQHRITNLWDLPEFRRYCRPTISDHVQHPGIVIPFASTITSQMNFFGWPLIAGDSSYSTSNYSTKIRSVGVWFSNYNSLSMVETPRVYLIPVGIDILRSPTGNTLLTREWQVLDQRLPVPFPISYITDNNNWMPSIDTLSGTFYEARRYSDFRAYHDSGLKVSEVTYDSRLIGRSIWNTEWLLIIPGASLSYDPDEGLDTFIYGSKNYSSDARNGDGVSDIKIFFHTYAYSGN